MLYWLVIVPIIIAVFLLVIPLRKTAKVFAIIAQTALLCSTIYLFLLCKEGDIIVRIGNYEGVMGILLKADVLSSVFIMLSAVIFLFAAIYSFNTEHSRIFWSLLFIWEGLLIGIFLSSDLFNLFVLTEVATVVVSIHIMLKRNKRSMFDGMIYLMANTVAIQFYLFGAGYIYKLTGVLDMETAALAIQELKKTSLVLPFALFMTSISLKCALMPLFSWLPRAHGTPGAPSAVSAILSGLHIKSGIYLFIRFADMFQELAMPEFFLTAGIITGIAGFILALSQSDIKLILAYSTISQIGMIMIGLNIGNEYAYTGGIHHIINHAFFKTALFLFAGILIKAYGTRDINQIRGVLKRFPLISSAAVMAILGITGAPFFNGSISKYFIMSGVNVLTTASIVFINLGTIIIFIKFSTIFFGIAQTAVKTYKKDILQYTAVIMLGLFCLAGGILGEQVIEFLFNISVNVDPAGYLLKIVFFTLSAAAGLFIYRFFVRSSAFFKRIRELELNFRGICVSIGIFFAIMAIVARLSAL